MKPNYHIPENPHNRKEELPVLSRYDKCFAAGMVLTVGSFVGLEVQNIVSKIPTKPAIVAPAKQSLDTAEAAKKDTLDVAAITEAVLSAGEVQEEDPVVVSE